MSDHVVLEPYLFPDEMSMLGLRHTTRILVCIQFAVTIYTSKLNNILNKRKTCFVYKGMSVFCIYLTINELTEDIVHVDH